MWSTTYVDHPNGDDASGAGERRLEKLLKNHGESFAVSASEYGERIWLRRPVPAEPGIPKPRHL